MTDPYVVSLVEQQKSGYNVSKQLDKLWKSHKTYCYDQVRVLYSKANSMAEELGTSPMEYYIHQCIAEFECMSRVFDQQLVDLSTDERQHLLNIFRGLPLRNFAPEPSGILDSLSKKIDIFVDALVAEVSHNPDFTGLVFVEQRVWVAALAEILSLDPRTRDLLRIGTFVGTSNSSKRRANIAALAEPKNQQNTLDNFRTGGLNLILATSVLEEGIDVSNCHLVVCFERPKNLKSFVQRRGRARKQQSRYFICKRNIPVLSMCERHTDPVRRYLVNPDTGAGKSSQSWQSLEDEMRKAYEDDMRQVKLAEENEKVDEPGERYFRVQSTG
jgi:ERCC4-related helicase